MARQGREKHLQSLLFLDSFSGGSCLWLYVPQFGFWLLLESPDNFRNRVLELNASDERGIAIVREKIKNFARQTPRAQTVSQDGKTYPCPPYKIIILDEADSMTQDAQSALRRIMETYARITRFCFVCNYVTRIIEPLASRCSKFRFKPLESSSTSSRIKQIADAEHVPIPDPVINTLISVSSGDLRRAITYLQSASRLSSSTNPPTEITSDDIQEIAGVVPDAVINSFGKSLGVESLSSDMDVDSDEKKSSPFETVQSKVKKLIREGYSASQLLSQVRVALCVTVVLLNAINYSSTTFSSSIRLLQEPRNPNVQWPSRKPTRHYAMERTKNFGSFT